MKWLSHAVMLLHPPPSSRPAGSLTFLSAYLGSGAPAPTAFLSGSDDCTVKVGLVGDVVGCACGLELLSG